MEFKSSFTTIFFLFLFLAPYSSTGESSDHDHHVVMDGEIYEIDYRGPETHSSIPPPDHTHHAKPLIHKETSTSNYPKSKASDFGRKVKKIHG